ncbi:helix-turn-helix transcriptional regulator [Diaphorobacter sp. HDW4B]|uniref:helix-turn-helix domain-containing protein n=1 Tax=Diaphorobacter sp. HDW4B TaxID=2714925 RepID=UPI00140D0D4B|nr:helix-turn-helix transcriptional regulator [Diaphorobacter sp. HDW4B]QIL71362.1 helix-turn-helix transcriptional regulator [Diaphorobacter sp. HDW4B]
MVKKKATSKPLAELLGVRIAELRKSRQWTQAQLAERIEVEPETISRFERGATVPSLHTLEKLAQVLRASIGELLVESSTAPDDQATRISAWLSDLTPNDRALVTDVVKRLCDRLR